MGGRKDAASCAAARFVTALFQIEISATFRIKKQNLTIDKLMLDVILFQPEIPPNTGNIIRLCANTGARLHLIKPLGFILEDKQLRRAGLDYHEFASMTVHENWINCAEHFQGHRLFAVSTKGKQRYDLTAYAKGDAFLFGSESRGLPAEILESFPEQRRIRVPMVSGNRSLNLSNTVAVVIYEAWRQMSFEKGT